MTITIATRADVRSEHLDRFLAISADIVGAMLTVPGNLGVRITNADLAWFTLTAWADSASLAAFVFGDRHRRAMDAVDQLTHGTAFATIESEVPFDRISWDDVKELLAPVP